MSAPARASLTRLGWTLALPVLFLLLVGLLVIHVTDRTPALPESQAPAAGEAGWLATALKTAGPLAVKQTVYALAGLALLILALLVGYQKIGRLAYPAYAVTMLALVALVVDRYIDLPLIPVRNESRRWISLGPLSLQPSEFVKIFLVVTLARYLRFRNSYRTWWGLLPPFLLTVAPMALILKQPDLGTTLLLLPVLFAMLFAAGARRRHLATIVALGLATLPLFYVFGMKPYQRERILVLLRQDDPDPRWHLGPGYQLHQSKTAIGSGGTTGEGFGRGVFVQYELLPEEHNDFVFAIVCNQWGLVGAVFVLLAYAVLAVAGFEVATVTNDPFGRLIAVGIVAMIVVQALLNMCVTLGLAPISGMPLPFVSAGGSSLWTNFIALGLLISVAQRRPLLIAHPPFEHRDD